MEELDPRPTDRRWRVLTVGTAVGALVVMSAGIGVAASGFDDVPDDHAFSDEISWLADTEISSGYPDGTFRPDSDVTRQAMAAFMQRLAGHDDEVAPVVRAEHAQEADEAEHAQEADEAEHAQEADDAATLDGRSPDAFLTKSGWTSTAIPPHAFMPGSDATVTRSQGYARFERDNAVLNMYGQPQLDTARWGEEQYLHGAEVCLGEGTRPVTAATVRVYRQPPGEEQTEIFSQDVSIDSTGEDCHRINVDTDQDDDPDTKEGFELAATDYVEVRVHGDPAPSGHIRLQGGTITTSQFPSRVDFDLPPIIIDPPIIIGSHDASGADDPELGK